MHKKEYGLLLVVGLVFWTAAVSRVSAETAEERQTVEKAEEGARETLRGLKGVGVVVERVSPDAERDGLTQSQLQTDVELRLRKAGIPALTQEECRATPGHPFLYVNVNTHRDGFKYAFASNVTLEQEVILKRNSTTEALAETWSFGPLVGTVGKDNLREVRKYVADLVDAFINAYLAVNPK